MLDSPAGTRAPEGRCKHKWAKCLYRRILQVQALHHPVVWYAQYQDGDILLSGTAREDTPGQWVFQPDEGAAFWCTQRSLTLCGHKATADAQQAKDEA